MGYIFDTARDRTQDLFRPKREPIPLGHSDGRQVLIDLGLVSPIDWSKIMDRSKIRRERSKTRENLQQNGDQFDNTGIQGVFFDGRKDQTLTQVLGICTTTTEIPPRKNTNIIAEPEPVSTHYWVGITFCRVRHSDIVTKPDCCYYYYTSATHSPSQVKIPQRQVQEDSWSRHSTKRVLPSPGESAPGHNYGSSITHMIAGIASNDKGQSYRPH